MQNWCVCSFYYNTAFTFKIQFSLKNKTRYSVQNQQSGTVQIGNTC